jgi:hypothetical protein
VKTEQPARKKAARRKPERKSYPCHECGKPGEFFIAGDTISKQALMTLETVKRVCRDCMMKLYFPDWARFNDDPRFCGEWRSVAHRV